MQKPIRLRAKRSASLLLVSCMLLTALTGCGSPAPVAAPGGVEESVIIERLSEKMQTAQEQATLIKDPQLLENKIALLFEGITDESTMLKLLDILKTHGRTATFFLSGTDFVEASDLVRKISSMGHSIGGYGMHGEKGYDEMTDQELIHSLYRTQNLCLAETGLLPPMIRFNGTAANERLLKAAALSGVEYVVEPTAYLNYSSFSKQEQASVYAGKINWGSVISIKIGQQLDESEYPPPSPNPSAEPEISPKPMETLASPSPTPTPLSENERLLQTVDWLLTGLDEVQLQTVDPIALNALDQPELDLDYNALRDESLGQAEVFTNAATTAKAVSLVFDHFPADREMTVDLMMTLQELDIHATFVVTGEDTLLYSDLIFVLQANGHSFINGGLSGNTMAKMTYEQICRELAKGKVLLNKATGTNTNLVYLPFAFSGEEALAACANLGFVPCTYNKHPLIEEDTTAQETLAYFEKGFHRGDVISLRMDNNPNLCDVIRGIHAMVTDTGYGFMPLQELYDGQYEVVALENIDGWDAAVLNPDYDNAAPVSSFALDHIPTGGDKVIFLTFDDWGGDKTITTILDTLKEYDVKASFFIRGAGAELNPNLLRAIAEDGHDICNHTYSHPIITDLTEQNLQMEVVKCHQVLTQAIGRCPELYFRPPTLTMDTATMNTVRATGYSYSLQANISTQDYERTAEEVVDYALDNAGRGQMVIMHLTDHSSGQNALGTLIEGLRAQGYKLAKISDYLPDERKAAALAQEGQD